MGKRDRDIVLARRRAFLMAAAATTIGCGERIPCLSPMVCLSPMPPPCPDERYVLFEGASVALSPETQRMLDDAAGFIRDNGSFVQLVVRVFDDGHTDSAKELHQPRLDAVRDAFVAHQLGERIEVREVAPNDMKMNAEQWLKMTGNGNPTPLSGLVLIVC